MKVPVSWLREYVDFDLPVEELARRLVFSSCEVDRVVRRGVPETVGNYEHFVVGKVLEAGKHPNADKLRGEVSEGMILSERELELGQDHGGIMLLPDELAAGTPLAEVLPLGDDILEIETLYNRPDLTSVYGIAREVAALLGTELRPMPGTEPARDGDEPVEIAVEDLGRCPRYLGRLLRDVTLGESPAWLKARLIGAGMRPISNVVDVTNYVMLALGNPLHAFDYDKLVGGRIVVRAARAGEKLETPDGTERELG